MVKTSLYTGGTRRALDQLKPLWFKCRAAEHSHKGFAVLDPLACLVSLPKKSAGNQSNYFSVVDFLSTKQLIWQNQVTTNEEQPYCDFF